MAAEDADGLSIEEMADQILELSRVTSTSRRVRKIAGSLDLSYAEFLALDVLGQEGSQNVGALQRRIGVLPAQMSRVIKSLETRFPKKLVRCSINPQDKRKIDVSLTEAGRRALAAFKKTRRAFCVAGLTMLSEADRREFMRILRTFHEGMARQLQQTQTRRNG